MSYTFRLGSKKIEIPSLKELKEHTHAWNSLTGRPSVFPASAHSHTWSSITDKPNLSIETYTETVLVDYNAKRIGTATLKVKKYANVYEIAISKKDLKNYGVSTDTSFYFYTNYFKNKGITDYYSESADAFIYVYQSNNNKIFSMETRIRSDAIVLYFGSDLTNAAMLYLRMTVIL